MDIKKAFYPFQEGEKHMPSAGADSVKTACKKACSRERINCCLMNPLSGN
jgi:hypothetical protein